MRLKASHREVLDVDRSFVGIDRSSATMR